MARDARIRRVAPFLGRHSVGARVDRHHHLDGDPRRLRANAIRRRRLRLWMGVLEGLAMKYRTAALCQAVAAIDHGEFFRSGR